MNEDVAELVGIHIGDGCMSVNERYSEYYLGGDLKEEKEYHNGWVKILFDKHVMVPILNKKVEYKEHPKVGVYGFYIFDKKIVDYFNKLDVPSGKKLNIRIPKWIKANKIYLKRFLRGLFDTDGNIYFDKNRSSINPINNCPQITLDSVSSLLVKDVFESLIILGLNPRLKKPYKGKKDKNEIHTILIYRKSDLNYFINQIGFKNPKHYTKWMIYEKYGYCLPHTTLEGRFELLK